MDPLRETNGASGMERRKSKIELKSDRLNACADAILEATSLYDISQRKEHYFRH
mgnify:CR=1 FL=1